MPSPATNSPTPTRRVLEAPRVHSYPVIGSIADWMRIGGLNFVEREWKKWGDTFRFQLGPRNMIAVAHPDAIENVFGSRRDNYVKGPSYDNVKLLTGDGLLTMEGDAWRTRRRIAQPSFHRESINKFTANMVSVTRDAIAAMRVRHPSGGTVDVHHEMMVLTLEVVGQTLFGMPLGNAHAGRSGEAFASALEFVSERGNSPMQLPLIVPTPGNIRFRRVLRDLDAMVLDVVAKARTAREARAGEPASTLIDMLLDSRDADTGTRLTDQDIRNETITLFLAGHETTALLLTWGFTLLAREPEIVAKMREEVSRVVGDREPSAADVPKLTYVRRVVDEILRLRPPVWIAARDIVAEDDLAGYRVRPGDVVMPAIFLTHKHPDFWKDPERFDPDRFAPEAVKARSHWAYLPFTLGPRMCIGNVFTLVEATVVFAMLLQAFEFDIDPAKIPPTNAVITARPAGPVPMSIRWRS